MDTVEIGIVVSGGVVTQVYSNSPVYVHVLDLDIWTDEDEDNGIITIEGDEPSFGETVYSQLVKESKQ